MKLSDKNIILEALRNPNAIQWIGEAFGPGGSACGLGHIMKGYFGQDFDSTRGVPIDWNQYYRGHGLSDQVELEGSILPLHSAIIRMNDDFMYTLAEIADWIETNVIPEDLPEQVPADWNEDASRYVSV